MSPSRRTYIIAAVVVIAIGIISRLGSTGYVLIDKYLGDALYAALIYLLLRIGWPDRVARDAANFAMVVVFVIELLQLTGVPLAMRQSGNPLLVALSIGLGTTFGWPDVMAYAFGILGIYAWDVWWGANGPSE